MMRAGFVVSILVIAIGCGGRGSYGDAEDCGSAGRCASMCAGSAAACYWAGAYFQDGRSGPEDHERALEYYQRGCKRGELRACRAEGMSYLNGIGVARDATKADTLFLRLADRASDACKKKDAMACQVAASLFDWGRGVARDGARAESLWLAAADAAEAECERGRARSCMQASSALSALRGDLRSQHDKRRTRLERVACEKGEPAACMYAARALSDESEGASSKAKELYDRADEKLQQACDRNNISRCIQLYRMLETRSRREGMELLLRAVAVADKVCKLGAAWSCERVFSMLRRACSARRQCSDEQRRALELRAFAAHLRVIAMQEARCRAGRLNGCEGLARELMPKTGNGSRELREPARELYDRLCSAGRASACYSLASSYRYDYGSDPTLQARGLVYLEKGCALGDGFSCDRAAEAYREGKYVLRDEVRAQELAHKACRADAYFCRDKQGKQGK